MLMLRVASREHGTHYPSRVQKTLALCEHGTRRLPKIYRLRAGNFDASVGNILAAPSAFPTDTLNRFVRVQFGCGDVVA